MKINKSPWIHQLDSERKTVSISSDINTDISIIGAGIAGVSSAFFILKYTNKRVVMLDQFKLAHGATGHNAGQVVARFERPLSDLENEFGFEKVKDALHDLKNTWNLIDEIYKDANLDITLSKVKGKIGFSNIKQVILALKDFEIEKRAEINDSKFFISEDAPFLNLIPKTFEKLYTLIPKKEILSYIETNDQDFDAVYIDDSACVNSALFCQEVIKYLQIKYQKRFVLYENNKVNKIVLHKDNAILDVEKFVVNTERVVLCTNGFENFDIYNKNGLDIDKKFHHLINGSVGYMSGYLENINKEPTTIAYLTQEYDSSNEKIPYFYLTRRVHEYGDKKHNLICVGGPEIDIDDRAEYLRNYDYPDDIPNKIDEFIKKEYDPDPNRKIDYEFTWHGLMGYTPNRVRLIGEEPKNKVLIYNLGCNGIGIIPSILGGKKISKIIKGDNIRPSIFDPK